jgi:hypothetical protein
MHDALLHPIVEKAEGYRNKQMPRIYLENLRVLLL